MKNLGAEVATNKSSSKDLEQADTLFSSLREILERQTSEKALLKNKVDDLKLRNRVLTTEKDKLSEECKQLRTTLLLLTSLDGNTDTHVESLLQKSAAPTGKGLANKADKFVSSKADSTNDGQEPPVQKSKNATLIHIKQEPQDCFTNDPKEIVTAEPNGELRPNSKSVTKRKDAIADHRNSSSESSRITGLRSIKTEPFDNSSSVCNSKSKSNGVSKSKVVGKGRTRATSSVAEAEHQFNIDLTGNKTRLHNEKNCGTRNNQNIGFRTSGRVTSNQVSFGEKTSIQISLVPQNNPDEISSSNSTSNCSKVVTKTNLVAFGNELVPFSSNDVEVVPNKRKKVLASTNIRKYSAVENTSQAYILSTSPSTQVSSSVLSTMATNQTSGATNYPIYIVPKTSLPSQVSNPGMSSYSAAASTSQFNFKLSETAVVPFDSFTVPPTTQATTSSVKRVTRGKTSNVDKLSIVGQHQPEKSTGKITSFTKLQETYLDRAKFECKVCKKKYIRSKPFKKHLKQHEEQEEEEVVDESTCSICKKVFLSDEPIEGERPSLCKTCSKKFKNIPLLSRPGQGASEKTRENIVEKLNNIKKEAESQEVLTKKSDVKKASAGGTSKRPKRKITPKRRAGEDSNKFMCDICPEDRRRDFKNIYRLNAHKKLHYEPRYSCGECGKKFYSNGNLKVHQKTHQRKKRKFQ